MIGIGGRARERQSRPLRLEVPLPREPLVGGHRWSFEKAIRHSLLSVLFLFVFLFHRVFLSANSSYDFYNFLSSFLKVADDETERLVSVFSFPPHTLPLPLPDDASSVSKGLGAYDDVSFCFA